jgi:hypothetical protein
VRDSITVSHVRMFLYGIAKAERKDKNKNSGINVFLYHLQGGWVGLDGSGVRT